MTFSSSVYQIFSSKIIPQTKNLKKKNTSQSSWPNEHIMQIISNMQVNEFQVVRF